jgi:hypothetical protein
MRASLAAHLSRVSPADLFQGRRELRPEPGEVLCVLLELGAQPT